MSKKLFLQRMFLYKLQYIVAAIMAIAVFGMGVSWIETTIRGGRHDIYFYMLIFISISTFNTVTYFYSKCMSKKYGINMFDDLDQEWLKDYQGYDSKAFGEIFCRLIQCRKIAGPYGLSIFILSSLINIGIAFLIAVVYTIGYLLYRDTYLGDALADRVPRVFGGGGNIVSKIIDNDFKKSINWRKRNEKLAS